MLSQKAIVEFRKIMKEEYGQELSLAEAEEQGNRLVHFFETLVAVEQKTKVK